MAEGSTALDIVKSKLPSLCYGPSTTDSESSRTLEFRETLCYWSKFERKVRNCVLNQEWPEDILDHKARNPTGSPYLSNEYYLCGDKVSVQSRFAERICSSMTAIFMASGFDIGFGDYKTCISPPSLNGRAPDFAIISKMGIILAAGTVKTPWKHGLAEAMKDDLELRGLLAHVIRYMLKLELKFGFLTTYHQTIFVKQERIDGKAVIYYSNVINHDDAFQDVSNEPECESSPKDYHGKVTLRECFFYIGTQIFPDANNPEKHTIPMPQNCSAIVKQRPKSRKAGISNVSFQHVSDNETIQPPCMSVIPHRPEGEVPAGTKAEDASPKQVEGWNTPSLPSKVRYEGEAEMSWSARGMVVLGILIIILALSKFTNIPTLLLG